MLRISLFVFFLAGLAGCSAPLRAPPRTPQDAYPFSHSCGMASDGTEETGYTSATPPCNLASRRCVNGQWDGPVVYRNCVTPLSQE